jgi:hypothetical protein
MARHKLTELMACLEQALAIFRKTGQLLLQGRVLMNLSGTQRRPGLLKQARASAQESADTCERLGDRLSDAGALAELAAACRLLGWEAEAAAYSAQALSVHRRTGPHWPSSRGSDRVARTSRPAASSPGGRGLRRAV